MAEMSLGDFFSQKKKPKKMGSNLNNQTAAKAEAKKTKNQEEDGWDEQEATAASLKVEIAGKLTRDDDKKEDEGVSKAAWGNTKTKANADLNERKFPSLAKSVQSSNISLRPDDKQLNIETSKNLFSALEGDEDDDEEGPKRPNVIKPAMVTKKKGEFEKVALQREVDKYKGTDKKKKPKKDGEEEEEDEEDEEEEEKVEVEYKKKVKKKEKEVVVEAEEEEEELAEDVKIVPDLAAAKAKYQGRRKLAPVPLSRRELEEEKENKPAKNQAPAVGSKNKKGKKGFVDEEDMYEKKLLVAPDDF